MTAKLGPTPEPADFQVLFSNLVVLAFGVLHWFESETVRVHFWSWPDKKRQLASLEHQAILYRILTENVDPHDPSDPEAPYKKTDRKKRPQNRVVSAVDPDLRAGAKSKTVFFLGDKIQVVTSMQNNMVLNAEPIAGNEPDGERLLELVHAVRKRQKVQPAAVVADSAYSFGRNRRKFIEHEAKLVAPLKSVGENATGLFSNEQFTFCSDTKTVTCPAGQMTSSAGRNEKAEGTLYHFSKRTCLQCPLREQCTTGTKKGRGVFISDYIDEFLQAKIYNETEEGKALLASRSGIERKNHEMKNHNGLGHARVRTREKRRIEVKLVSMVVNLKQIVKQHHSITLGFVRKKPGRLRPQSAHCM